MKYWEVIKALTDDPTRVFERKDRYKHWVMKTDIESTVDDFEPYYFVLECDGKDSYGDSGRFSGNLAINEDDWQEVKHPVTWQEAIQAWADGKKVVWEEDGERRVFDRSKSWAIPKYQSHLLDQDGDAVTVRMISVGKWYVED